VSSSDAQYPTLHLRLGAFGPSEVGPEQGREALSARDSHAAMLKASCWSTAPSPVLARAGWWENFHRRRFAFDQIDTQAFHVAAHRGLSPDRESGAGTLAESAYFLRRKLQANMSQEGPLVRKAARKASSWR
jgi:hypothetical protein